MHYGIPYKGNKSKIAEAILEQLPAGRRLVDLFGGGFAITDCAMRKYPYKWERFFYNDHDARLQPLIMDAIRGKYNLKTFTPVWVSRADFHANKTQDGYTAFVWSFGNNGNDYLYGADIEDGKRKAFEFIVNGTVSDITKGVELLNTDITGRRLEWAQKAQGIDPELARVESLEKLQCLTQLEALGRLEALGCMDYREYKYQDGDVIYCDIPYDESGNYTYHGGGSITRRFTSGQTHNPHPYITQITQRALLFGKKKFARFTTARTELCTATRRSFVSAAYIPRPHRLRTTQQNRLHLTI